MTMAQFFIEASKLFVQLAILLLLIVNTVGIFFSGYLPTSMQSGLPGGRLPREEWQPPNYPMYHSRRQWLGRQTDQIAENCWSHPVPPFQDDFGCTSRFLDEGLEPLLGTEPMSQESLTDGPSETDQRPGSAEFGSNNDTLVESYLLPEDASDAPISCEILSMQISSFLKSLIAQMEKIPLNIGDDSRTVITGREQGLDFIEYPSEDTEHLSTRTEISAALPECGDIRGPPTRPGSPECLPTIEEQDGELNYLEAVSDETTSRNDVESLITAEECNTLALRNADEPFTRAAQRTEPLLQTGTKAISEVAGSREKFTEQLLGNYRESNIGESGNNVEDASLVADIRGTPSHSYTDIIPLIIKNIEPTLGRATDVSLEDLGESLEESLEESGGITNSTVPDRRSQSSITFKEISKKYDYMPQIVAGEFGMTESTHDWDVYWVQDFVSFRTCRKLKSYQRINHFPGSICLSNKDLLGRNLNAMLEVFPKGYDIFPKTWFVPLDMPKIKKYARENMGASFIVKPHDGSCGSGIRITRRIREIGSYHKTVCQLYIQRPLLIDGYKFDFRVYVLLTSVEPLRIFVHKEGLARFATVKYEKPSIENSNKKCMHLTNTHINKNHPSYVREECSGTTRRITTVFKWFEDNRIDVKGVRNSMDDTIIKTIIASLPTLQHYYHMSFPYHTTSIACFELMGFDIMLDNKLKVYLLEVNVAPSFTNETGTSHVARVKREVVRDAFKILNLMENDRNRVIEAEQVPKSCSKAMKVTEEKKAHKGSQNAKRTVSKTQKDGKKTQDSKTKRSVGNSKERNDNTKEQYCKTKEKDVKTANDGKRETQLKDRVVTNERIQWENAHMGNFRKIYPPEASELKYYQTFMDAAFSNLKPNQYLSNEYDLTEEQRKWLT